MSLPAIAIVVSSVSAFVALCSFCTAFLTYRRVRPRVRVSGGYFYDRDRTEWSPNFPGTDYYLSLRVNNHGQSPVKLYRIVVQQRDGFWKEAIDRFTRKNGRWRIRKPFFDTWYPTLPDDLEMTVDPFNGVAWEVPVDLMGRIVLHLGRVRLRIGVELSTGVVIYQKAFRANPGWPVPELTANTNANRQLTFDDIEEESGN
ncbi:hypothetical protein [Streptomyces sp. NPDC006132]|uniref:hypothetical protein n=1 Tax=Streptomyces sp. NPDC006132 TaxID=3156732 RepID=UPI0033F21E36